MEGGSSRVAEALPMFAVVDSLPAMVTMRTSDGRLTFANRRHVDYFGRGREDLAAWVDSLHPDDRQVAMATWREAIRTSSPWQAETRLRDKDGAHRWFDARWFPLSTTDDDRDLWYSLEVDIDDRKRRDTLVAGEKRLLEMVASGITTSSVLDAMCLLVEKTVEDSLCSIVLVDRAGARLEHGAAPSLPASFIDSVVGRPVNMESGPCAMAAYLNEQVIASDIRHDTRWSAYDWCPMALAHGLRSCWSTPIESVEGRVLGAFAVYYREPRSPTDGDLDLIRQLTHVASIAIDRQRAQISLRQALDEIIASEGKLRTTIDAIPGFVWSATPDGYVDFLNERWCEYTGAPMNVAAGDGWHAAVHPSDIGKLSFYWRSLLQRPRAGEIEARLRRFDGSFRWFLIRAMPLRDAAGDVVKWYGQNTDIEERKQAEAMLAGEKRLLEMVARGRPLKVILSSLCELLESTASGFHCSILVVDQARSYLGEGATQGLRLVPGAAPSLPQSLMEGIDGQPVDETSFPCAMAAIRNEQVIAPNLAVETRWDAWRLAVLEHGLCAPWSTPIRSPGGKVVGTFAILFREPRTPTAVEQDLIAQFIHLASIVIERSQSESALKRSEAFLAKAQRLSSSGSFSWHAATGEIVWSDQVYRIFEVDPGVPVTLELIRDRHMLEDRSVVNDMVSRVKAGRDFEYEHRLQMPGGRIKYLHTVAHGCEGDDGHVEYIGAVHDVSARRQSEEALAKIRGELAHVSRVTSLGVMTASIAHEVNQPLSGIITNASTCLRMLAAAPPKLEGARETARRIIRDGNRASDVITKLRALFSKKTVAFAPVDVNVSMREIVALTWRELQRGKIALNVEASDTLPTVVGDRVQIQQVILNLIMNAAEALGTIENRARRITVRTRRNASDEVELSVEDNGPGMDMDTPSHEKLFEPFYTTKPAGMGIGLSVSRSIIESHHGRLWVQSNPEFGLTFLVALPHSATDANRASRGP